MLVNADGFLWISRERGISFVYPGSIIFLINCMETKKRLWGAAAIVAVAGFLAGQNVSAQTLVVEEEIVEVQPLSGTQYYSSKGARSNWFISVGAGTQTYVKSLHRGKQQFTLALDGRKRQKNVASRGRAANGSLCGPLWRLDVGSYQCSRRL